MWPTWLWLPVAGTVAVGAVHRAVVAHVAALATTERAGPLPGTGTLRAAASHQGQQDGERLPPLSWDALTGACRTNDHV